jgi:hypothetical protein
VGYPGRRAKYSNVLWGCHRNFLSVWEKKLRFGKKHFVCDGQNLFWPKNVLFWADKITTPEKTLRSLQNNIVFRGKNFVWAEQNLFCPEKVLYWPDKIFSSEKMFCFCRIKSFLPKKSFICFGRDFFWSNETFFRRKRSGAAQLKSFFFRTRSFGRSSGT